MRVSWSLTVAIRKRLLRLRMKRALSLLRGMDSAMGRLGWSRQRQRAFWRAISKAHGLPEELLEGLARKME